MLTNVRRSEDLKQAFETARETRRRESEAIRAFREPHDMPPTLFHYTTAAGLKGIVEEGAFWFSNAAFFSDATELTYGLKQVGKVLDSVSRDLPLVAMLKENCKHIPEMIDVYAACFCKRGDLLSQWRGYGHAGGGYSIGIEIHDVLSVIKGTPAALFPVVYDPVRQAQIIRDEVVAAGEALAEVIPTPDSEDAPLVDDARNGVLATLSLYIAAMKDPVFQGEEEYRLIQYRMRDDPPGEDVRFRVAGRVAIPFISTRLCHPDTGVLPISRVIIGPTVDHLAERSVKTLLRRYSMWEANGRQVELKRSSVPLQSLV